MLDTSLMHRLNRLEILEIQILYRIARLPNDIRLLQCHDAHSKSRLDRLLVTLAFLCVLPHCAAAWRSV